MNRYVVDTHALVWYLADDSRLGAQAEAILDNPDVTLIIPVIVLAEINYLGHRGCFAYHLQEVLDVLRTDPRCVIQPIDLAVVQLAPPNLDIHDSLIVGVALSVDEPINGVLTRDDAIAASGVVPTIW